MSKIRVTKQFEFETAHALYNYDGLCKNIHGHSYKLQVTVIGEPIIDDSNPKFGMVIDFGQLKEIVKSNIVNVYDHSLILSNKSKPELLNKTKQIFDRLTIVDYQPTCENMVNEFAKIIITKLPKNIDLFSVKLYETSTSYAEWFAADNRE